jgi:hypothetical protein
MPFGASIQISPTVTITVEVAGGSFPDDAQKNIIEACSFWQSLPTLCPMPGCGAPLVFTARHPQNYHYYGLRCEGPKPHEMNFGERKDHTSLYLKDWKDANTNSSESHDEPASAPAQSAPGQAAPAQAAASPTGDKVDAGTVRMIQAVANGKKPAPNVDGIAQQFFGANLVDLTKENAMAVLEFLKTI